MMSFSKHAKGFPSSSDGHHFVRNMHEFRRENRFFVMFWGTCPIGLLTGMNDSSQATMDSPVTIGRGIIWTLSDMNISTPNLEGSRLWQISGLDVKWGPVAVELVLSVGVSDNGLLLDGVADCVIG